MARLDPHSYADDAQGRTRSFELKARVDFDAKVLHAEVTLQLLAPARGGPFDLDTRGLTIEQVEGVDGRPYQFTLHPAEAVLGSRLTVQLPAGAPGVRIRYRTSPEASALQWLAPEQTLGARQPFLFSQCQAIHARSVVPCQDTPAIRQTYTAQLDVPKQLKAVMAAARVGRVEQGGRVLEQFSMPQPIPPYLFAFAVGDLQSKALSPRCAVWAEPGQLEAAAWEFAEVERFITAAEGLFGPYDWERFDLLVMPPSFPYGGMENPRLTFLTPALIAGDRSQVNVVGHELAHSWTGNLVTNANAEHFWLNEGFTVFAERRIVEATEGLQMAMLQAAVGLEELNKTFAQFASHPEYTRLQTQLQGVDPDEVFSVVPYEKGYLFLKTLEAAIGPKRFDVLLKAWLTEHRFGAATTNDFTALVERVEPGLLQRVNANAWLHEPGLPADSWRPMSERLQAVRAAVGTVPQAEVAQRWSPTEWQLFLEATPHPSSVAHCRALDAAHQLTKAKNPEILVSWLTLATESGDGVVLDTVDEVLGHFGRLKYLRPLYRALLSRPETKARAKASFERNRARYHPIAQQVIGAMVAKGSVPSVSVREGGDAQL